MLERFFLRPALDVKYIGREIFAISTRRMSPPRKTRRLFSDYTPIPSKLISVHSKMPQGPDPYVYTTGRWLHRDQLQHGARLIQFDFFALCQRVIALCPGSSSIKSYDKKEGGFNSVFIFQMDNGASIVARIPFRIADPETLTTNSEVATMTYSKCESVSKFTLKLTRIQ